MTLQPSDYENIIAKISRPCDGGTVGTGFAIAQRYVLTCAHVVLEALAVEDKEDEQWQSKPPPEQIVHVEFPINSALERKIFEAVIVDWVPAQETSGDIAILRLLQEPTFQFPPASFASWNAASDVGHTYRVQGFPQPEGRITLGYQPMGRITDHRLQLNKPDDSTMNVIKGGYSGSPLLDIQSGCIIGMIVATEGTDYRAFAISCRRLKLFGLEDRILAHEFCDGLGFENDDGETLTQPLGALLQTLDCGSAGSIRDRLSAFSGDRPFIDNDWKTEGNLIYFVTSALVRCQLSPETKQRLAEWMRSQGHDVEQLKRKLAGSETQSAAPITSPTNILVKVNTDERPGDAVEVEVWIYAVGDQKTYNPNNPPDPICRGELMAFSQIPKRVWDVSGDLPDETYPVVHYFLPRPWFDYAFEMSPVTRRQCLGGEHCVVLRTNLEQHPSLETTQKLRGHWKSCWARAHGDPQRDARKLFKRLSCADDKQLWDCLLKCDDTTALLLNDCDAFDNEDYSTVGEFIEVAVEEERKSLSMLLWSRASDCNPQLENVFPDGQKITIADVPDRIRKMRREGDGIGVNLALVWEDPNILLPRVSQFEAS